MSKPRILVSPLDWGLGHATRLIPVIDQLIQQGAEVIIGANGRSLTLLQETFPRQKTLELPGYKVSYSRTNFQVLKILTQIPRLVSVIKEENRLATEWVKQFNISGIISDNRYGIWNKDIPSIFICHQISPIIPEIFSLLKKQVYNTHLRYMRPFREIWIPDFAGDENISGELSHHFPIPENAKFIGPLSRFQTMEEIKPWSYSELKGKSPDILAVLSGPEPQRSIFENRIVAQSRHINRMVWIVQGRTEVHEISQQGNVTFISFMGQNDLYRGLKEANMVISRSGYSSIMDFIALGIKKWVLIPTPGQTEQEYLAKKLSQTKRVISYPQNQLNLSYLINQKIPDYSFVKEIHDYSLVELVGNFLTKV